MTYQVEEVRGFAPIEEEVSEFLAEYVKRGEFPAPNPGERFAEIWRMRFAWWWNDNPFFHEDTLKAFLLRTGEGKLVGFHGFIPCDYERDGVVIPSLIATSFLVAEGYRDASLGVSMKMKKLAASHHIVDGGPSQKLREILDRFQFQSCCGGSQYYYFAQKNGWHPRNDVARASTVMNRFSAPLAQGTRVIDDPGAVSAIGKRVHDGKIHRRITLDSLNWMNSVGTRRRHFFGLVDRHGRLLAYFFAIAVRKYGLRALRVVDYANLGGAQDLMPMLLAELCRHPESLPLTADIEVLIWTILRNDEKPSGWLKRSWVSDLYYKTPGELEGFHRDCLPFEGDILLL